VRSSNHSEQDGSRYHLRLFIAGTSARSLYTLSNLNRICDEHLNGRLDLEVIDIYQRPDLAELDQVVAAPTLVKLAPAPVRRIVGDLANEKALLDALNLAPVKSNDDAR
jgi:circadian clock protein KaiB